MTEVSFHVDKVPYNLTMLPTARFHRILLVHV